MKTNKTAKWHWFEPVLTYDNAILPLALLNAYEITSDESVFDVAFESMDFLESKVFHDGILSPIGNDGWFERGKRLLQNLISKELMRWQWYYFTSRLFG